MKRIFTIFLLFLYLPAVCGVAVSSHYCCGKMTSVRVQLAAEVNPHHNVNIPGCCNDVNQILKIHNPQQTAVNTISCKAPVVHVPAFSQPEKKTFLFVRFRDFNDYNLFHAPPGQAISPLFLLHGAFLI